MPYIDLVPIGPLKESYLTFLGQSLPQTFKIQTRIRNRSFDLTAVYDSNRNQYHSSGLLFQLIQDPYPETLKIMGITELDLFIPIFTFLFGEAQLKGMGALVSTHRLKNQFYGLPEDEDLLKNRLLKECIHELGHTFGLIHCFNLRCVMNTSTYVEDIDQKSANFCKSCERVIFPKGVRF